MQENQNQQTVQSFLGIPEKYVPSGLEKKKAVVMYVLFGILMIMNKPQMSVFEFFHLRQAVGRWVLMVMIFIVSGVLWFVPIIGYLGLFPLFIMLVLLAFFFKQAWDGGYYTDKEKSNPIFLFSGLGGWLLNLFDINPKIDMGNANIENAFNIIESEKAPDSTQNMPNSVSPEQK